MGLRRAGEAVSDVQSLIDRQAIHDNTAQARGFAYMSTLLDQETRVSTIFGAWFKTRPPSFRDSM